MVIFKIVLLASLIVAKPVDGVRCYSCGFTFSESDQSCLTITNSTNSIECTYKYCTIVRQEYTDPAGAIASFLRSCDNDPDFLNHEVSDPTFMTYYRACTTDLCNIGNGIQSVVGGDLSPYPVYSGNNLLVPGTGSTSGSYANQISIYSCILVVMISMKFIY